MTKHLTSFEDSAGDIAKYLERKPQGAAAAFGQAEDAWHDLLDHVIEREILPRLSGNRRASLDGCSSVAPNGFDAAITGFVALIIDDNIEQLRAVADRVILRTGGRDALLNQLLTPAARLLGQMWEQELCDFMTVTLGIYRLNQIMKETQAAVEVSVAGGFDYRVLLLPAPGEQHGFGINVVADAFRADGWCVRSTPAVDRKHLLRLVKDEWFDVVGLSVSTERCLKGLASCISALRMASCNPRTMVMLGGRAITCHPERSLFLGADTVAEDAKKAVRLAKKFMESKVTERFPQFITKPIDAVLAL